LAQSKILLFPGSEEEKKHRSSIAWAIVAISGIRLHFRLSRPDRGNLRYPEISGYASGCSFIIRPEVFLAIGGYDEEYYMYHDDLELDFKGAFCRLEDCLSAAVGDFP
jgi:GT2 family glycosyltransferase